MKILLIRVSSLGDVLHNMPIVHDLQTLYPDAQIDWVVEEAYTYLVQLHPAIRKVIPFALRRWRKSLAAAATRAEIRAFYRALRADAYDLILDTQGLMKTGIIMGLARTAPGGRKVGLANGTEGSGYEGLSRLFHDLSVPVPLRTHAVLRGRLVVAAAAGTAAPQTAPVFGLNLPQGDTGWLPDTPYIVFFHGTAGAAKKWPRQHWIALAERLQSLNLPVLLPWGSPAEQQEAEAMAAAMPNARVLPKLSMQQAIILARRARLAVGVDTGLTHIAAAYLTPTVEIYCASPKWKTEGNWAASIINLGDAGQSPEVAAVWQACQTLLAMPTAQDGRPAASANI